MSYSIEAELQNTIRNDRDLETGLRMFAERLLVVVLADETIRLDRVLSMEAHRFPELGKLFYESGPGRVEDVFAIYLREKVSQGILNVPNPPLAANSSSTWPLEHFNAELFWVSNDQPRGSES